MKRIIYLLVFLSCQIAFGQPRLFSLVSDDIIDIPPFWNSADYLVMYDGDQMDGSQIIDLSTLLTQSEFIYAELGKVDDARFVFFSTDANFQNYYLNVYNIIDGSLIEHPLGVNAQLISYETLVHDNAAYYVSGNSMVKVDLLTGNINIFNPGPDEHFAGGLYVHNNKLYGLKRNLADLDYKFMILYQLNQTTGVQTTIRESFPFQNSITNGRLVFKDSLCYFALNNVVYADPPSFNLNGFPYQYIVYTDLGNFFASMPVYAEDYGGAEFSDLLIRGNDLYFTKRDLSADFSVYKTSTGMPNETFISDLSNTTDDHTTFNNFLLASDNQIYSRARRAVPEDSYLRIDELDGLTEDFIVPSSGELGLSSFPGGTDLIELCCDPLVCIQECCPEDFNGDCVVDVNDFLDMNSAIGNPCDGCPEDLNGDGVVDVNDFLIFNTAFGEICLPTCSEVIAHYEDFSAPVTSWWEWSPSGNVYANFVQFSCSEDRSARMRTTGQLTLTGQDLSNIENPVIHFCAKNHTFPVPSNPSHNWDANDALELHGRIDGGPWILIGQLFDDYEGQVQWHLNCIEGLDLTAGLLDLRFSVNTTGGNLNNKWSWIDNVTIGGCDNTTSKNANPALTDLAAKTLLIFPNPASDVMTIGLTGDQTELMVFDMSGKLVYVDVTGDQNYTLDISDWKAGLYLVQAVAPDGTVKRSKMLKL